MKKVLILLIAVIGLLAFGTNANAQSSQGFDKQTLSNSISISSDADKLALENMKATNAKMFRDFSTRFKGASEIRVDQVGKSQMISCSTDGGWNRITYNKNGKWQHTIRTYGNEQLPDGVREHIEYVYPRYSIFGGVIEVSVGDKTAYLVTIEDKKTWKRVRVVDGDSDVYEGEYKKSK